jgi:hypothetical protein
MIEGNYKADLPDNGPRYGDCTLRLEGGRFELQIEEWGIYSIHDGNTFRGTFREEGAGVVLEATEHYSYTEETTRRESTRKCSDRFKGRFAEPEGSKPAALDLEIPYEFPFCLRLWPVPLEKD